MSLDDERVRFYFRHREEIEQWAALRSEAAVAVDEWLVQLAPDVEALAASLETNARLRASIGPEQGCPSFRLLDATWGFGELDDPPACVALEWARARTTMRGSLVPYIGVRSLKTTAVGGAIRLSEAFRQARLARKDAATIWWGSLRYIAPDAEFPGSADAFKEALLDALRDVWRGYAEILTTVIAASMKSVRGAEQMP